jgi:hypothetical protein
VIENLIRRAKTKNRLNDSKEQKQGEIKRNLSFEKL